MKAQMSVKEEFESFSDFYYFDYNVLDSIISFWDNPEISSYQTSFCLYYMLKEFYNLNKICIPYSMAHIWDIKNGTKNFENKVNIVKEISKGWFVKEDDKDNNSIRVDKCDDVNQHFNDVFETMKLTENIQGVFDPLIEATFRTSLLNKQYSDVFSSDSYSKLIDIYNKKPVKTFYDVLQFSYKTIGIINIKNNIDLKKTDKEELKKRMLAYLNKNLIFRSLNINTLSDYESFYSTYTKNLQHSEFSKKILSYSLLCDYIGITKETKEKIDKETFASGMINDSIHLSMGLRCHKFVTNDNNLKIKAIVCKILFNLNVNIFSIEDFFQHVVNEYAKVIHPNENKKEFTISLNFNGKSFQKTLTTNYEKLFYD
jgi:hypothetical protein